MIYLDFFLAWYLLSQSPIEVLLLNVSHRWNSGDWNSGLFFFFLPTNILLDGRWFLQKFKWSFLVEALETKPVGKAQQCLPPPLTKHQSALAGWPLRRTSDPYTEWQHAPCQQQKTTTLCWCGDQEFSHPDGLTWEILKTLSSGLHSQRRWGCGHSAKARTLCFIMQPRCCCHKGGHGNHWPRNSGNTNERPVTLISGNLKKNLWPHWGQRANALGMTMWTAIFTIHYAPLPGWHWGFAGEV